ncbi:T-box transcription factor TBX15 [Myotis brandtii]|uniref:T-box transcription factor TBX15 n=1 Tax=Myotis brandtii TaxID=109478 RepID=S7NGQ6_MYOBR|nr:T-box transcription factor TBX15 [Myotis brandtii]
MSERRRSAVALSSRAHAFSVEALIGSNKKRKLRDWEEKGLDLSMEALSPAGPLGDAEDAAAHGLKKKCWASNPSDSSPLSVDAPPFSAAHTPVQDPVSTELVE